MTQKMQMVAPCQIFCLRQECRSSFSAAKIPFFRPQIFRHFQNMFRLNQKYDEWGIIWGLTDKNSVENQDVVENRQVMDVRRNKAGFWEGLGGKTGLWTEIMCIFAFGF